MIFIGGIWTVTFKSDSCPQYPLGLATLRSSPLNQNITVRMFDIVNLIEDVFI